MRIEDQTPAHRAEMIERRRARDRAKSKRYKAARRAAKADLREAIRFGSLGEVTAILDAYEHPKWPSREACEKDFVAAKVAA